MRIALSLAAAAVTVATPASADWSFTRWGMTPAQVVRASGGTARLEDVPPSRGQTHIVRAVGTVRSGDLRFTAHYRFFNDRLVSVTLLPTSGSCSAVHQAIGSKYGRAEPRNQFMPFRSRWSSRSDNLTVTVEPFTTDCDVTYRPLADENSAGL